jgi:PKD repeat protein
MKRLVILAALAACCIPAAAGYAYAQMSCRDGSALRWSSGAPEAISILLDEKDWVQKAYGKWNNVDGVSQLFSESTRTTTACYDQDGGINQIAWDDGRCMSMPYGVLAVTVIPYGWSCTVNEADILINVEAPLPWDENMFISAVTHEMGHYITYEHEWYELSIMGYEYPTVSEFPETLFADDYQATQVVFGMTGSYPPELMITRFRNMANPVPDSYSIDQHPQPKCNSSSSGCTSLNTGESIVVGLTVENRSATAAGNQLLRFILANDYGKYTIGEYALNMAAYGSLAAEYELPIDETVPGGTYKLMAVIDPDDLSGDSNRLNNAILWETPDIYINQPPVADFECDPISGDEPLSVLCQSTSTGEVAKYTWTVEGAEQYNADGETATFTLKAGVYDVTLKAGGAGGQGEKTRTAYIIVNAVPLAADFACDPLWGLPPFATLCVSNSKGSVDTLRFEISDGNFSEKTPADFVLVTPGYFDVTLTVFSSDGSHSITKKSYLEVADPVTGEVPGVKVTDDDDSSADGSNNGDDDDDGKVASSGGCGCDAGRETSGGWGLLGFVLAVLARFAR